MLFRSRVALVTDGRMSGASGKGPAAIHVTPEAARGGPIARLRDGDVIRLDATAGTLTALVPEAEWAARAPVEEDLTSSHYGLGRELFAAFRAVAGPADRGAHVFGGTSCTSRSGRRASRPCCGWRRLCRGW